MQKENIVHENDYFMQSLLDLIEYEQTPRYAKFLYDDYGIIVSADFSLLDKRLDSIIKNEIVIRKGIIQRLLWIEEEHIKELKVF